VLLINVKPLPDKPCDHISARSLTVVGEEAERNVPFPEFANEPISAGNHIGTAVENTVHIDQKSELRLRHGLHQTVLRDNKHSCGHVLHEKVQT
jgi:hypothetical protein